MKNPVILIWGITVLVVAGLGFFVLWPWINQDINSINEAKKAQTDLAQFDQKKVVLTGLAKRTDLDKLSTLAIKYVPEDTQAGELILMLTNLANQASLTVNQATFSQADGSGSQITISGTTSTAFGLKLSGDFVNLINFLNLAQTSNRLVILQSMNLHQTNNLFSADINGTAFFKKGFISDPTITNITLKLQTIQKLETLGVPINQNSSSNLRNPFTSTP